MTTTINASTSSGLVQTADGSGIIKVQSNGVTTNALAWVVFNGTTTGTNAPTAAYNVSSVTRTSTGLYSIAFTNALSDANYSTVGIGGSSTTVNGVTFEAPVRTAQTTSAVQIAIVTHAGALIDVDYVTAAVFR